MACASASLSASGGMVGPSAAVTLARAGARYDVVELVALSKLGQAKAPPSRTADRRSSAAQVLSLPC